MKYLVLPFLVLFLIVASCGSNTGDGIIKYNGGHVLTNPVNVYIIWYGNWNRNSETQDLVNSFINNIDSTSYYKINQSYYELENNKKVYVTYKIRVAENYHIDATDGSSYVSKDAVPNVVISAINKLGLSVDPDGLYLLLADDNIQIESMCSTACGWHKYILVDDVLVPYAVVINTEICPHYCHNSEFWTVNDAGGQPSSPNENLVADGMINVIMHELAETLTDPFINGWNGGVIDGRRIEIGDKCEGNYGKLYATDNHSYANLKIYDKDFLVQELWYIDQDGGRCAMSP